MERGGIKVIEKNKQAWRENLATKVAKGEYLVFTKKKWKQLISPDEVLTSDSVMMDMFYFTPDEIEKANGDPRMALLSRVCANLGG